MIDGGDGKVEIWRIEDNTKVPVPKVINKRVFSINAVVGKLRTVLQCR